MDDWPPLPTSGFISGRAAVEADYERGDAVFYVLDSATSSARMVIPQFAYLDAEGEARVKVVVVQAEDGPNGRLIGMRDVQGKTYIATAPEVTLLGTKPPL